MRRAGPSRLAIVVTATVATSIAMADGPSVESLAVRWEAGELRVSYRVDGGLTDAALERLHSGIPLRFRHRIELRARRAVPLWPSRELGRTTIETRVEYDSLTQQYRLVRDTRIGDKDREVPEVVESTTGSLQEMQEWMTRVADARIVPSTPRLSGAMRVRVEVTFGRRWVLLVFPATVDASATVAITGPG